MLKLEAADRRRITVAAALTVLALPILVNQRQADSEQPQGAVVGVGAARSATERLSPARDTSTVPAASPSTVVVAAVDPAAGPTLAAPSDGRPTGNDRYADGWAVFANFDNASFGDRSCLHRTLPIGATVTVTDTDSGRSTWCVVRGRGPNDADRLIALDSEIFAEIADLTEGAVPVRITW